MKVYSARCEDLLKRRMTTLDPGSKLMERSLEPLKAC